MKIGDLSLLKQLGKGTMGEVFISQKDGSKEYYATKKIDRRKADRPQVRTYFINEIKILKELKHKKIVKYYDLKQTKSHYYIVMEYCNGGSLLHCLDKYMKMYKMPFSETIVQYLMKQIVSGLKYIHSHGIIHRDIKLDNILVKFYNDEDLKSLNMMKTHIKITDFGISIRPGENHLAYTALGSPANMDPFILKKLTERNDLSNSEGYDQSADIWSLGSICYEMLIGKRVFNGRNIKDLSKKVEEGNYTLPTHLSKEVVSFINGMLQYDHKKRLTCEQLSRHPFLTRNVKNFSPIDFSLIYNKIGEKGIVVNTKENKTIWQAFNANNSGIMNNNVNNNNINNSNMWDIFNKETEIKLSNIPYNILDKVPYSENDTSDNTFDNNKNNINNYNINNNNNNQQKEIKKYHHVNTFETNNNNKKINNNQIKYQNSDNTINKINYNNFNIANSQLPFDYKYPKQFPNYDINKTNNISNINNNIKINQNQYISSPEVRPENNNMNFYQGNNVNNKINQTQINPTVYVGDIKIQKKAAVTDESCLHQ